MTPRNTTPFPHHTPNFLIDDDDDDGSMLLGLKTFCQMTIDYLNVN